jgi:hypothetical protein
MRPLRVGVKHGRRLTVLELAERLDKIAEARDGAAASTAPASTSLIDRKRNDAKVVSMKSNRVYSAAAPGKYVGRTGPS